MRPATPDVPADLLAERRQLGLDKRDEMWEGELHMVPPPEYQHGRIGMVLAVLLHPLAAAAGLEIQSEFGLYDPDVPGHTSYRVPDLVVFDPTARPRRGVEGTAALVIEIASPGDESLAKLPFYERVGVAEVLIIDRDTKALRHWTRHADRLVETKTRHETETKPGTHFALVCLPVTLRTTDRSLHVETPGGERRI